MGDSQLSINRTFQILQYICENPNGRRLTQIAQDLSYPKSSTHLILSELVKLNLLTQLEDKTYVLGLRAFAFVDMIKANSTSVYAIVRRTLMDLATRTGEDAYFGIRDRHHIVYVDKVEGAQSMRLNIMVGTKRPFTTCAVGRVHLAFMRPREVTQLLNRELVIHPQCRLELEEELKRIRRSGYAITHGTSIAGIVGLAVPIFERGAGVFGVLHISTPDFRSPPARISRLIKLMQDASDQIVSRHAHRFQSFISVIKVSEE